MSMMKDGTQHCTAIQCVQYFVYFVCVMILWRETEAQLNIFGFGKSLYLSEKEPYMEESIKTYGNELHRYVPLGNEARVQQTNSDH